MTTATRDPVEESRLRDAYQAATAILYECGRTGHADRTSEVSMGKSVVIRVCCDCWNRHVAARRAADKLRREIGRAAGRRYWTARGIDVGQKVKTFARSWLGFGSRWVYGTAKVGVAGAYVTTAEKRGQLDPGIWASA